MRVMQWNQRISEEALHPITLAKDYYTDGLRTLAVKIGTMSAEGGPTRDPNYTPGVDFLDHDFL